MPIDDTISSPDTESELINILGAGDAASADVANTRVTNKLPDNLPILGVSDVVIFPGMVAPLLVESDESTRLIDDVVEGDRLLGLVLQKRPELQNPGPSDLHGVGCGARVLKMLKFPDNTIRILIEGIWRIRIKDYTAEKPYLRAEFNVMRDTSAESVEVTALARHAQQRFREIMKLSPAISDQVKVAAMNTEQPGALSDLIAGWKQAFDQFGFVRGQPPSN